MPPFGSWVVDEESGNQVAVVYHATTMPIDSIHRARALGLSLQDLREQQPQIFAMLKTEFRAAIVGFELGQGARFNSKRCTSIFHPCHKFIRRFTVANHKTLLTSANS